MTVGREHPTCPAMSVLDSPWAASSRILARSARAARIEPERLHWPRVRRSSGGMASGGAMAGMNNPAATTPQPSTKFRDELLEPKWQDHQLRYARVTGQSLDDSQVGTFIVAAMREPLAFAENLNRVFDRQAKELAFGPPGVPGDPARIEHLGHRLVAIYEDFLDWSARLRGTVASSKYRRLLDLAASTADMPAKQIRDFIDQHVATLERLPELLAEPGDEPIDLTFVLELDIDRRIIAEYNREFKRLRRRGAFE